MTLGGDLEQIERCLRNAERCVTANSGSHTVLVEIREALTLVGRWTANPKYRRP